MRYTKGCFARGGLFFRIKNPAWRRVNDLQKHKLGVSRFVSSFTDPKNDYMKKNLLFFLLIALTSISFAQDRKAIHQYLSAAMDSFNQDGMTVGVLKNGELVYTDAFGYSNKKTGAKANTYTTFELASLSKAFTAASVGILVDNGLIKWDDKVISHLPDFRMHDPYVQANMTVEDLLCHRNGYNTFDGDLLWYGTNYTAKEIAARFSKLAPKHGFRDEYGYSNLNFVNAGLLIEKISGQSWAEFVKDSILTPLKMEQSFTTLNSFLKKDNIAHPHVKGKVISHQNFDNCIGAVGVRSNIHDLSKWANMWLNQGMLPDSTRLLESATVDKIFQAHTARPSSKKSIEGGKLFSAAALGWFVGTYNFDRQLTHSGGLPGFILNLSLLPEKNLAVIVLTNSETVLPFATTNYLMDLFADTAKQDVDPGKPSNDWVARYLPYNKKEEKEPIAISDMPAPYNPVVLAGTYEDKMYGKAKVEVIGGMPYLTLLPAKNLFYSKMEFVKGHTYRIKFNDPFLPEGTITFDTDSNNYRKGFTIDLPNPDFHFYNLDFKRTR